MRFEDPWYFLLLIPVFIVVILYFWDRVGREGTLRFSSLELVKTAGGTHLTYRRFLSGFIRAGVLILLITALARPQTGRGETEETKNVIDIMLAVDISSSMATLDFHPDNRLEAAKLEARRFIERRPNDRVGLVVFAKESVTQCPLTTDRQALLTLLGNIRMGILEDGTAIGVGLANAVNRLKDSEAKSKVVILLTDGINNSGEIDPLTAAKIAKTFGVRVYTIGMGVDGEALIPIDDPRYGRRLVRVDTQIDEAALTRISTLTNGLYFRARNEGALKNIFNEIDKLEKTEIKVQTFTRYDDHYALWLKWGLTLLILEILMMNLVLRRVP